MQMRSCVFLNDETQAFRGLHALHAAGLTGFIEVAFGAVAGQQFLDHGVLSYGPLERKADRHVKVPASGKFKTEGSHWCSQWRPDRWTACHKELSGSMSRNGTAFVAS